MNPPRRRLVLILLASGVLVLAGALARQHFQARADWERALPPPPDLAGTVDEFHQRVAATEVRVRRHPRDPAALADLTYLYLANGFDSPAKASLQLLVEIDPDQPRWPHLLARLLAGYGDIEAALPLHARAVALAPDYLPARIKWADALLRHNETAPAAAQYRAALDRKPDLCHALLGLARIDFEAGRLAEARATLERTIAADPSFTAAHVMLSTLLEKQGDQAGAVAARARATNLGIFRDVDDPWNDEPLAYCYDTYRLRIAASSLGYAHRPREGIALLERAIALRPEEARTHWQLGQTHRALNDFAKAKPELERAIALDPKEPGAYLDLVRILKAQRDLPGALHWLAAGLKACPDSSGLHFEYAQALVASGRPEDALPHLRDAQRLLPDDPAAYQEFAIQCFKLGREAEGVQVLETALARIPRDGQILALLVRYHVHTGDEAAAANYLRRAREADLDSATLAELEAAFRDRFGQ